MHDCTDFIVITIHDTYDLRILFGTVWSTAQCLLLSAVEARYDVCYLQWHHVEVAASSKGCLQETSCKQSNFGSFCSCPQRNGWHSLLSSIINTNIYQFKLQTKIIDNTWQLCQSIPPEFWTNIRTTIPTRMPTLRPFACLQEANKKGSVNQTDRACDIQRDWAILFFVDILEAFFCGHISHISLNFDNSNIMILIAKRQ